MENKLTNGFPLEKPDIILEWGKPLDELAKKSGGIWNGDRYYWKSVVYLQGLEYPLCSENGILQNEAFVSISACIGLDQDGLWSDELSLSGFNRVSDHLTNLFGKPISLAVENELGEKSQSWNIGNVHFYLSIVEQHTLKCYLKVGLR